MLYKTKWQSHYTSTEGNVNVCVTSQVDESWSCYPNTAKQAFFPLDGKLSHQV